MHASTHGGRVAGLAKGRDLVGPPGDLERVDGSGVDRERVADPAAHDQAGSPSARRSRDTFDCTVFALVETASSAHRSSSSRSLGTIVPAASARRISSSVGLPAGTATSSPSRRTSTGPSSATEITTAG